MTVAMTISDMKVLKAGDAGKETTSKKEEIIAQSYAKITIRYLEDGENST